MRFDEESHTYTVGGREKESVTDILKEFGFQPRIRYCTDEGMWRGQQIHKALEFYHKGTLNVNSLDPLIRPYLDAWRLFEAETGFQAWGWETALWDPTSDRCGRPDVYGQCSDEIWVLDYKSGGVDPVTGLQLAAYQSMLCNLGLIPIGKKPIKRFAIQLKPTGRYNIRPFNDEDDLVVWHFVNNSFNYRGRYVR